METTTDSISPKSIMNSTTPDPLPELNLPPSSNLSSTKAVKKRKSWGQQLPEPTTNLPPRKRAKTEDEKEQRRIERIKRNRAAAHNSRERKRHEAELLAKDNDTLLEHMNGLRSKLRTQESLLNKCRELLGEGFPSVSPEEVEMDSKSTTHLPSPSPSTSAQTIDPRASLTANTPPATSPCDSTLNIKLEEQPDAFELGSELDQTQQSAALLCPGLQCQSSTLPLLGRSTRPTSCLTQEVQRQWQLLIHTILIYLALTLTNSMTFYRTILLSIWARYPASSKKLSQVTMTTRPFSTLNLPRTTMTTTSPLDSPRLQPFLLLLQRILNIINNNKTSSALMTPAFILMAALAQQNLLATGLLNLDSSATIKALMPAVLTKTSVVVKDDDDSMRKKKETKMEDGSEGSSRHSRSSGRFGQEVASVGLDCQVSGQHSLSSRGGGQLGQTVGCEETDGQSLVGNGVGIGEAVVRDGIVALGHDQEHHIVPTEEIKSDL